MTIESRPTIVVAADGSEAVLVVPARTPAGTVRPEALVALARLEGVVVDANVRRAIDDFARHYAPGEHETRVVIAQAVPPTHGQDGRVEWSPGFDPTVSHRLDSATGRADHYAGKTYIRVNAGDVIGVVHQPTQPRAGRDVRGRAIGARTGRPVPIRVHPTLQVDESGRIVARTTGVLVLERHDLRVSRVLEIGGAVDFSTGNVDFAGNVVIAKGVCAGFKVRAAGDLSIGGLIEAAEVSCGGNLTARTGMAGQGRGTLTVEGDAHVVYLERVRAAIRGSFTVDRAISDCRLIVGGRLHSEAGTILGGEVTVTGAAVIGALGSPGGVPTTIVLDDVPFVRADRAAVEKALARAENQRDRLVHEDRALRLNPRLSPKDRERLTEIAAQLDELRRAIKAHHDRLTELEVLFEARRTVDLYVAGIIHAGVTLRIGEQQAHVVKPHRGPLFIFRDERGEPAYRVGTIGAVRALSEIARLTRQAGPSGRTSDRPAA